MSAPKNCAVSVILTNVLEAVFAFCLMHLVVNTLCLGSDEFEGFLLCRQCGLEITRAGNLVNIPSQQAHRQRNDTLSGTRGVLIQLFKNPEGKYFEVITSSEAEVQKVLKPQSEHSFFPGFSWTVAVCPRCGHHLGWVFDPLTSSNGKGTKYEETFIGLILGSLLHEQEAESMIVVPKTYHS